MNTTILAIMLLTTLLAYVLGIGAGKKAYPEKVRIIPRSFVNRIKALGVDVKDKELEKFYNVKIEE